MTPEQWAESVLFDLAHGDQDGCMDSEDYDENRKTLADVIRRAVAEERETNAKLAEDVTVQWDDLSYPVPGVRASIAAAIRARSS